MKNADYEPFGPFTCPSTEPAQRSMALVWPTGPVKRVPESSAPIDVAPRNDTRRYDDVKVHGARAALTFVADETRAAEPTATIQLLDRWSNANT